MSKTGYIPLKQGKTYIKPRRRREKFWDLGSEPKKPPLVFRDLKTRPYKGCFFGGIPLIPDEKVIGSVSSCYLGASVLLGILVGS